MKKILVPTDFSKASKAGLRFAINLSRQMEVQLVFFHCFQLLVPSTIHPERIAKQLDEQEGNTLKKLQQFVNQVYAGQKIKTRGAPTCVVFEDLKPDRAILEYAEKQQFDFICMCTRGAGAVRKLIGTHTGDVLRQSKVPVLVIPDNYRTKPIQKILYNSDFKDFDAEMATVNALAADLQVNFDMVHFYSAGEIAPKTKQLEKPWKQKFQGLDRVILRNFHLFEGYAPQLVRVTKMLKPGIAVYFSHSSKTWYDKFFGESISEKVSFSTSTPMLVYRKK